MKTPKLHSRAAFLAMFAIGLGLSASALDIRTGLVSYWPLNIDSGDGTTPDVSFGNNMTIVGGSTIGTGQFGNAFTFNGSSKYLTISHTIDNSINGLPIYPAAAGYTVCMWVKGAAQTARYLFTEGSTASNNQLLLIQTGNAAANNAKVDILIRSDASTTFLNHIVSSTVVFNNAWHHVAWVDNHGSAKLYIDGNLDSQNFNYVPVGTLSLNTTSIGQLVRASVASGNDFNGSIDDVAVWERPLSQAEVQSVMTNSIPTPIPTNPPVLLQPLVGSTNAMGDYVVLPSFAVGFRPLTYQWFQNGNPLPATTRSLTFTSLDAASSNDYSLIVSNPGGSVTNSSVPLVVLPDTAPNLSSGLISYWPLDTVTTNDTSPDLYSHDDFQLHSMDAGSLVPGPFPSFTNALSFNAGSSQYCSRVGGTPLFNSTNYTVSLWVNGGAQAGGRVYAEGSTNNNNALFTIATDSSGFLSTADIFVRNDAGATSLNSLASTSNVFDGNWHHVVWVDQNGKALLYVDGVLDQTSFAYTRTGTYTLNTTAIGAIVRTNIANAYTGLIDEVAVWNRRLSYTEIQAIQSTNLPPPVQLIPPSITKLTLTPSDVTNSVFVGDSVTFGLQTSGTTPFSYQWYKNSQAISTVTNSTATNDTLALTNVHASDNGSYFAIVTNGGAGLIGGATTSAVVQLTVHSFTPTTNGTALDVDFDAAATPSTQPGFQSYVLTAPGAIYTNGIRVTVSPVGNIALADRLRNASPFVTNDPPLLDEGQIYNDFIFANNASDGNGLSVLIEHLAPNTQYGLTVWSFDSQSTNPRVSDWVETASGTNAIITTGYTFDAAFPPTADYDDTFGSLVTSSPTGQLNIQGVRDGGISFGVFINGLQLVANPAIRIVSATLASDGNLQIIVQGQYPGQAINILESPALSPATWMPATDGTVTATHGPMIVMEFPISAGQQFYRAVSQ